VASYDNEIYLTFDTDWADEAVLRDTLDVVDAREVAATVFATHASPLLTGLAGHPRIEVGLHPNFNPLLEPEPGAADAATRLGELHGLFPAAVSIRSHSLLQSSGLQYLFANRGLTYEVNQFVPAWSGITCKPYREISGLTRVPYFWEDDVHVMALERGLVTGWNVGALLDRPGLKMFDFHPIHVYLNTGHMERYNRTRAHHRDAARLLEHRGDGPGTRTFLIELIDQGLARGFQFRRVADVRLA
jgi:peptidoglycan/xylan/chitin deacetylase (PgdA/CDA1 family)